MKGLTLLVLIINVEKRKVVPVWYSELGLCIISLRFFIMRANPDVLHLKRKFIRLQLKRRMPNKVPDNIAVIVRISLLHLKCGLLINIFDSWTLDNDVRTRRLRRKSDGRHTPVVPEGIPPSPSQEKSSHLCYQSPLDNGAARARA